MTVMTTALYRSICVHAGAARDGYIPRPFSLSEAYHLPYPVAVYIAVDYLDEVDYVGSTCRPDDREGLRSRMREHLRHPDRDAAWHKVWVVPLNVATPAAEVLAIEGMIGHHLRPKRNHRLPRIA